MKANSDKWLKPVFLKKNLKKHNKNLKYPPHSLYPQDSKHLHDLKT